MVSAVVDSNSLALAKDLGEVALDAVLEDGILRDIPIIGSVAKIGSITGCIRERLFAKKVVMFLTAVSNVEEKERLEWERKLENDPHFRVKVGEHLLLILDKTDHFDKATILGKLFAAVIEKRTNYYMFQRFATAINQISFYDLRELISHGGFGAPYSGHAPALAGAGLMSPIVDEDHFKDLQKGHHIEVEYQLTGLGNELYSLLKD